MAGYIAKNNNVEIFEKLGSFTGKLFQFTDDLLDVVGSFESMGKTIGKDAESGKFSAVSVYGIEGCKTHIESYYLEIIKIIKKFDNNSFFYDFYSSLKNRIKEEKFGFTKTSDVEMKKFEFKEASFLGVVTENTDEIIQGIFSTVGSQKEEDLYVVQGTASTNKINVEGQNYVSALSVADVYGATAKYDANRQNGVITISIALPDAEKSEVLDSAYGKVFNSENLLGATETTLNTILSGVADGTEVVHYKNAVLTAEFDVNTAEVLKYSISYETTVYIASAQTKKLFTLKEVNYQTVNTVDYIDFTHPTQK
jgi:hypothetical protein